MPQRQLENFTSCGEFWIKSAPEPKGEPVGLKLFRTYKITFWHPAAEPASYRLFHQYFCQLRLEGTAGIQALAQVGAQRAQAGYAGDDARLLDEGWNWDE